MRLEDEQLRVGRIELHGVAEVGEPPIGHVSQIAADVHELVVPQERVERAPCGIGLGSKPVEEIQDRLLVVSSVQLVSRLHHDESPPDPAVVIVDGAGEAQCRPGNLQISMHVPERHDPGGARASGEGHERGEQDGRCR